MLKVISSNIRFANPEDGKNDWSARKALVGEVFRNINADIIGTQEGREPQLRELHSELKGYQLADNHREWILERMYPCLFFKGMNLLASGDFWLSETPQVAGSKSFNSSFPRLCTWVKLQRNEFEFYVFNTHLDHTEEEVREKQAEVLIQEIQKIRKEEAPLILLGDFNTGPHSQIHAKILNSLGLFDPWSSLNLQEESSFHRFEGEYESGLRIDWVLCSGHFLEKSIEMIKESRDGVFLSDHFPICALLESRP